MTRPDSADLLPSPLPGGRWRRGGGAALAACGGGKSADEAAEGPRGSEFTGEYTAPRVDPVLLERLHRR